MTYLVPYSAEVLADVIPYALDPEWDGLTGESSEPPSSTSGGPGGGLLAMVVDIRRVLGKDIDKWMVSDFDAQLEFTRTNLRWLVDVLNGKWEEYA